MAYPIYTEVAGLAHGNRSAHIPTLMLGDEVSLQREPDNPYDPSAVRVVLATDVTIGYLPRGLAAQIAGLMDTIAQPIPAHVVALEGGLFSSRHGMRIVFELPDMVAGFISWGEMDYFFDENGLFGYVMLNCEDTLYPKIVQRFEERGFECVLHGSSIRVASDGRKYRWFIRIHDPREENGPRQGKPTEQSIDAFFSTEFRVQSERARLGELQKKLEGARRTLEITQHRLDRAEDEQLSTSRELKQARTDADTYEALAEGLEDQVLDLEKHKVILESEVEALRQKRNEERSTVARLNSQLEKLTSNQAQRSVRSFREDLQTILCSLLTNVRFLPGSIDELADMAAYDHAMRTLVQVGLNRPMAFQSSDRLTSAADYPWFICAHLY